LGVTLRYPYEVRNEEEYFDTIEDEKIPKDMVDLAVHIVETKAGHFKPQQFKDQYEDALKDLLRRKQKGEKIERPKERAPSNVINPRDARRQTQREGGRTPSARRSPPRWGGRPAKKPAPPPARHKKAS